jgi:hypothetical protein
MSEEEDIEDYDEEHSDDPPTLSDEDINNLI